MTIKELLMHEVQTLPESLTEQVLDYVQYLKMKKLQVSALPDGRPADYLLQFAGAISKEDLKIMSEEIEKGCERVDINEW
jgi:transcriptional regulator with AAA-type ATPase domain